MNDLSFRVFSIGDKVELKCLNWREKFDDFLNFLRCFEVKIRINGERGSKMSQRFLKIQISFDVF